MMEAIDVVCSIFEAFNPIELTPRDKLDDMLAKSENLKLLMSKFELTI